MELEIKIDNYRVLKNLSLKIRNPFTVIVGKNSAGKSSLLDYITWK